MKQYIQYEGTERWSLKLQKYLNDKMNYVATHYPKLAKHFDRPKKIQVLDECKENEDALGFFHQLDETVNVVAGNIESVNIALYVLFHEIGHSVVFYRKGLDRYYDSEEKNSAYYLSEIRADSYAAKVLNECFSEQDLAGRIKKVIKLFYQNLKETIVKERSRPRYKYIQVGSFYGNSLTTSGATNWYTFSGTGNSVTSFYGTYSNSNTTITTTSWTGGIYIYA